MSRNIIDADELIEALLNKQKEEHPVYEDTSGSMTYFEIIRFIKEFARTN